MKIGLFFGSFNPIHTGHLIIASHMAEYTGLKQVWFVVSPQNPLKQQGGLLNEYQRLFMVQLATEDDSRFKASDIEFKLPKPSYTVDTLTYLKEKYPEQQFSIIIGSDSLQNIHHWKNYEWLLANYELLVYERPGFKVEKTANTNIQIIKAPLLDISATYIRSLIKGNKSIKYLVPDNVRDEIEKSGYYK
ncbi:MAG: nicotinate-nucleotide adenylyltransferase [Sphingobacteriia bacterium]|nr:nicotinate-nucleotide adenylyltransferase [Sphingobacteriia bacterium]